MLIIREGRLEDVPGLATPSAESRDFYARLGFEPAGELNILRL